MNCNSPISTLRYLSLSMIMKQMESIAGILLLVSLVLFAQVQPVIASRGLKVVVNTDQAGKKEMPLYKGSYALLIGASNYQAGWPSLESIPGELALVESLLKNKGFDVEKHIDPDGRELKAAFSDFINKYGYDRENRLLFFYSGHGYTRLDGRKGYLVPVDAPNPDKDEKKFLKKALGMNQILSWSRDIEAKHALFLFDSCFSGTVFKQKDRPKPPKHITMMTVEPVRQFITAGQAGETVPANSTFTPMFIDAIKFSLGDLNRDGYVSGTELGLYLQEMVPRHANQNPQFGKISDYDLSRGDFIFVSQKMSSKQRTALDTKYQNDNTAKTRRIESTPKQPAEGLSTEDVQQEFLHGPRKQKISSIEKDKYLIEAQKARALSEKQDTGHKKINFMILINEKIIDNESTGNADKVITEYLLARGIEVVDSELIKTRVDMDQKLNVMTGSPQSAAALGMQFGADIVIIGKAFAKGSTSRVRDSDLQSYQATVNLKAVQTNTAEILEVDTAAAATIHVNDIIGGSRAIQRATTIIAERMIPKIVNKIGVLESGQTHKIRLIVNDVSQVWKVAAVKELLRKRITGVQDVVQVSFISGVGMFDVYSQGDAQYLAEELSLAKPQYFTISVIKVAENKLIVKLTPPVP